jgi:hypothetical protein
MIREWMLTRMDRSEHIRPKTRGGRARFAQKSKDYSYNKYSLC